MKLFPSVAVVHPEILTCANQNWKLSTGVPCAIMPYCNYKKRTKRAMRFGNCQYRSIVPTKLNKHRQVVMLSSKREMSRRWNDEKNNEALYSTFVYCIYTDMVRLQSIVHWPKIYNPGKGCVCVYKLPEWQKDVIFNNAREHGKHTVAMRIVPKITTVYQPASIRYPQYFFMNLRRKLK